jgi:hypothetical protein
MILDIINIIFKRLISINIIIASIIHYMIHILSYFLVDSFSQAEDLNDLTVISILYFLYFNLIICLSIVIKVRTAFNIIQGHVLKDHLIGI